MIKKFFYAANIIIAMVAGVDCFVWGMGLSSSTILWHNGLFSGYLFLCLLSLVVAGFCMIPSLIIKEWEV
jgi:hypothetical protein